MKNTSATIPGTLYIVATPIGNLQDLTERAKIVLSAVDAILAEDTRRTHQLCHALGLKKKLISFHEHNEHDATKSIIRALVEGQSLALVSDAGTPLISDPGYTLVKTARQQKISVVPIPGCCALITALCAAGVPTDQFSFLGFLPAKTKARQEKLAKIKETAHTTIVYEATHRILDTIDDIITVFGLNYSFVLAKELTKCHENILFDTTIAIKDWLCGEKDRTNGEFVLIFPAVNDDPDSRKMEDIQLLKILLTELSLKQAVKIAAQISSSPKNHLYELALSLSS